MSEHAVDRSPPSSNIHAHPTSPAWRRGLQGSLAMLGLPFRRFVCGPLDRYCCAERDAAGRIYILPGIEGRSPLNGNMVNGLLDAGLPHSLCVVDWTSRRLLSTLGQLSDTQRHQQQATALAESMVQYRRNHPTTPLHLIGHSGGTGIVAFAVAMLPADVAVDTVCLLGSALSPTFDLSNALAHCRRLVNFYSPLDLFFCGAGTLLLGSIDRKRTISAGAVGFRPPTGLDPSQQALYRERLQQRRFSAAMIGSMWWGGHQGCTHRLFIERYVAPELMTPAPVQAAQTAQPSR